MKRLEVQKDEAFDDMKWKDGVGFFLFSTPFQYGRAYFERYLEYDNTAVGRGLTKFRIGVVNKLVSYRRNTSFLLDIGSGTGNFIKELRKRTSIQAEGLDISTDAQSFLHLNGLASTRDRYTVLSFWDSFQHIKEPDRVLTEYNSKHVVVSIPIYESKEHIRNHTKFKPDQYKWYFTRKGFIDWMRAHRYSLVDTYQDEERKFDHVAVQTFTFAREE